MKTIERIKKSWLGHMFLILLLGIFLLPSCETDEINTTPTLQSFGPSPALRGGELRFIGQNLNQVTSIIFPGITGGTIEVNEISVINDREIKVVIPQDAGVGIIVLNTSVGEIKTITPLTFSEPITISSVTPLNIKAGEILTIEGDYLNLINRVIFFEDIAVEVDDFLPGQNRTKLQVKIPAEAQTGKIIISNGEEIPIEVYSDETINIALPSVDEPIDLSDKKPGDVIDIEGENMDLVTILLLPNGEEIDFEIIESEEGEIIRFILPDNMTEGTVKAVPASGVEVIIAYVGMALPEDVVATPNTKLRSGDLITFEGKNMELITSITFPGIEEDVDPESQTDTEITVTMPEEAISGNILLNTGSGMFVEVPIETLKPIFNSYQNNSVSLGGDVVIKGENLDLVSKVVFTGGGETDVISGSSTEITVVMPTMNTETGIITLYMSNGESVEIESLTVNAPQFAFIPILPGEDDELQKGGTVMTIGIQNGDKLTDVLVDLTPVQYIINNDLLYFEIPQLGNSNSKVTLVSTNGEITYNIAFIPATDVEIVIFNNLTDLGSWDEPRVYIGANEFERDIPAEAKMKIYFAQKEEWGQVQINDGHWSNDGIHFPEIDGATLNSDHLENKNVKEISLTLTPELVQRFRENGGIVMQGENWIISKISITYQVSLETTVWQDLVDLGNWSANYEVTPNTIFVDAGVKAGMKLRFYVDTYGDEHELQLFNGHWERIYNDIAIDSENSEVWNNNVITLPIDTEIARYLTEYIDWGYCLIVQGQNCILKKITIE